MKSEINIEQLRFEISQLRQDKIIYAVEAVSVNTLSLVGMFFASRYFGRLLTDFSYVFCLMIALCYTLYVGISNSERLRKIKKLESQLQQSQK